MIIELDYYTKVLERQRKCFTTLKYITNKPKLYESVIVC